MKDRVLDKNGNFQPFPKKLEDQAIKHGVKAAPADSGEPEPLVHSNAKAKQELALKLNSDAKIQAEMDKTIKERANKAALDAKAYEDEKAKDEAYKESPKDNVPPRKKD